MYRRFDTHRARFTCAVVMFCVVFLTTLTGCESLPRADNNDDTYHALEQALTQQKDVPFFVEGRLAAKIHEDAATVVFTWAHHVGRDDITLSTPLGTRLAEIVRDPYAITIRRGDDNEQVFAENEGEQALYQTLSFPLPIAALPYWLRGVALPERHATETRDHENRLATLVQDGWTMNYTYKNSSKLPDRVTAQHGALRGLALLKIKIDSWRDK